MPYELYKFDTLVLPAAASEDDVSTGQVNVVIVDLSGGGVWDALGTEQAKRRGTPLSKRCMITGTAAILRTQFNILRAYNGKRGRLWRRWDTDDTEWCWARMLDVPALRTVEQQQHQVLELQWMMISPYWYGTHHGGGWLFDAGIWFDTGYVFDETNTISLDTSPYTCIVNNGGNRTITNAALTISVPAGNAAITSLTIAVTGVSSFIYTGTIAAGTSLVIDCGAQSVINNGTNDYAHFDLHATAHLIDDWLRLEPGDNSVIVTRVGGGGASGAPTIGFAYPDGWE